VPGFEEKLRERGITLWLAGLNPEPLEVIRRSPLGDTLGEKRMFYNLQMAVEAYEAMDE
jgi:SulP family sulfate permease